MENNTPPEQKPNRVMTFIIVVGIVCLVASLTSEFSSWGSAADNLAAQLKEAQMPEPQVKAITSAFANERKLTIEIALQAFLAFTMSDALAKRLKKKP